MISANGAIHKYKGEGRYCVLSGWLTSMIVRYASLISMMEEVRMRLRAGWWWNEHGGWYDGRSDKDTSEMKRVSLRRAWLENEVH